MCKNSKLHCSTVLNLVFQIFRARNRTRTDTDAHLLEYKFLVAGTLYHKYYKGSEVNAFKILDNVCKDAIAIHGT
jgi:hypothetical protein